MATVEEGAALLTAEEFAKRADSGMVEELARGRIVMSPPPGFDHGVVCNTVGRLLGTFVADRDLGRVLNNDSGVITERRPDSVRGPDVSYYSYARVPRSGRPTGYAAALPELVFEVLSPSDRWNRVVAKAAEYVEAGVSIVVLLDPRERKAHVFEADRAPVALGPDDVLRLESVLPGFEAVVGDLFG